MLKNLPAVLHSTVFTFSKQKNEVHRSDVPIQQLFGSLSVEIIQNTSCFPCFNELRTAVENRETYQHLSFRILPE